MKNKNSNKSITIISYFFIGLMLLMIFNYTYFLLFKSEDIINNPYNKRSSVIEKYVLRGDIYSSDYKLLATSIENKDGTVTRFYPYGEIYSHVVGRYDKGKTGIESTHNYKLLEVDKYDTQTLKNEILGIRTKGYNIVTTLDSRLQQAAYDKMKGKQGAVVIIQPNTGKILTMVSEPSYDPNTILEDWDMLIDKEGEESSVLLNRVTGGLYPPGSTFKVVMAMEYLKQNADYDRYSFKCKGRSNYEDNRISCHNGKQHGTVDLYKSLAYSCNTSFVNIGLNMDISLLKKNIEKLGFNTPLELNNIQLTTSLFQLNNSSDTGEIMQTSIGQGKTMVTPFHTALIMCAIANDGELVQPYVVSGLCDDNKNMKEEYDKQEKIELIDSDIAKEMQKLLKGVVDIGTAKELKKLNCDIYGKTGSAEYNSNKNAHGWFVGCASPKEKEPIVIAVLVEDGETGSKSAVPIAKELIKIYMEQ